MKRILASMGMFVLVLAARAGACRGWRRWRQFVGHALAHTAAGVLLLLAAYAAFPQLLTFSFRTSAKQALVNSEIFVATSVVLYALSAATGKLALPIYQPVIYGFLSLLGYLLIRTADTIDNIGTLFVALFFMGWSTLFLHFAVATIPSGLAWWFSRRRGHGRAMVRR